MPIDTSMYGRIDYATPVDAMTAGVKERQDLLASQQQNALRKMQTQNAESEVSRRNALLPYEALEASNKAAKEAAALDKAQKDAAVAELDQHMNHVAYVNTQPAWDQWRSSVVAKNPDFAAYIPEEYSPANKNAALTTATTIRDKLTKPLHFGDTGDYAEVGFDPYTGAKVSPGVKKGVSPNPTGTTVNVGGPGSKKFNETMADKAAEQLNTQLTQAQSAQASLATSEQLAPLLNSKDFISGTLGDVRLTVAKALGLAGAEETQAYFAGIGQQVAERIKAFGAGTGLSDSDRAYAQKIAGGSAELTPDAIKRIVRINDESARRVINNYRERRTFLSKKEPTVLDYYPDIAVPQSGRGTAGGGAEAPASGWGKAEVK